MIENKNIQHQTQVKFAYAALGTYLILFIAVSIRDFYIHNYNDMQLEILFTCISLLTLIYFHKTKNLHITMVVIVWIAYGLILGLLITNKLEHYVVMYIVIVPLVPFFSFSLKRALWHIFLFYLLLWVALTSIDLESSSFLHDSDALFNLIINILFIFALGFIYHLSIKKTYAQLASSHAQNRILLQEVHHRVKNNLQMILSMVRLQRRRSGLVEVENELLDIENRINAIAKTYDKLIQGADTKSIDSTVYIQELTRDIHQSFGSLSDTITLHTELKAHIPIEYAVYIGLIVNELVTNAYKYAFIDQGEINIRLTQDKGVYLLEVWDNGRGFNLDSRPNSLGLKLVETLTTEQLHGQIEISGEDGTHIWVHFPKN